MNWSTWTKKVAINIALVGIPVLLMEAEKLQSMTGVPQWVPFAAGLGLIALRAAQNYLKHK